MDALLPGGTHTHTHTCCVCRWRACAPLVALGARHIRRGGQRRVFPLLCADQLRFQVQQHQHQHQHQQEQPNWAESKSVCCSPGEAELHPAPQSCSYTARNAQVLRKRKGTKCCSVFPVLSQVINLLLDLFIPCKPIQPFEPFELFEFF